MKSLTRIKVQSNTTSRELAQQLQVSGWWSGLWSASDFELQQPTTPQAAWVVSLLAPEWSGALLLALAVELESLAIAVEAIKFFVESEPSAVRVISLAVATVSDADNAILTAWARQHRIDLVVQPAGAPRGQTGLLVMDMDSTLIQIEVIDELAKLAGVGEQVVAITEAAMRGELDFSQSLRQRVSLLKGLPVAAINQIADALPVMDGAARLLAELKRTGCKTAILSGGFTYFAERLQQRFGIDYVFSNRLVMQDGYLTGEVDGDIVDAQRKQELLQQLSRELGLAPEQTVAVGDGANDLLMLAQAGLGVAFRAKPKVRQQARASIEFFGLDALLYLMDHPL